MKFSLLVAIALATIGFSQAAHINADAEIHNAAWTPLCTRITTTKFATKTDTVTLRPMPVTITRFSTKTTTVTLRPLPTTVTLTKTQLCKATPVPY